jgi:aryl-alcohol dehydrogenase-like predicted oxidoreductase
MQKRWFGGHGLQVSAIGLGTSRLNPFSGPKRFDEALAVIRECVARGITFFDTADSYGAGWSERWLGKALREDRADVMISTKFGLPRTVLAKAWTRVARASPITITRDRDTLERFRSAYARSSIEGSLRRLRTEYLDVVLLHSPPRQVIEESEWMETLSDLKYEGKIRLYGVSADDPDNARAAIVAGVDVIQAEINVCSGEEMVSVLDLAASKGVAIIGRQVFGSGSLLEGLNHRLPRVSMTDISAALLSEVLSRKEVSLALIGMRSVEHVRRNLADTIVTPETISHVASAAEEACREPLPGTITR